jgi:hypothetical protein
VNCFAIVSDTSEEVGKICIGDETFMTSYLLLLSVMLTFESSSSTLSNKEGVMMLSLSLLPLTSEFAFVAIGAGSVVLSEEEFSSNSSISFINNILSAGEGFSSLL